MVAGVDPRNDEVAEELEKMVEDRLRNHQSKYGSIIEFRYFPWLFRLCSDFFI